MILVSFQLLLRHSASNYQLAPLLLKLLYVPLVVYYLLVTRDRAHRVFAPEPLDLALQHLVLFQNRSHLQPTIVLEHRG